MAREPVRMIRGGFQALEQFLKTEKSRYSRGPVILIHGYPVAPKPSHRQRYHDQIETAGKQMELLLRHNRQLQTITVNKPATGGGHDYLFPTIAECHETCALADRVGAATIVATGNGVAMDLAKAVAASSSSHPTVVEQLILCPYTLGGALAATSPQALLWDPDEEALVVDESSSASQHHEPVDPSRGGGEKTVQTVVVSPSNKDTITMNDTTYKQNAILAAVTIALDCFYRDDGERMGPARQVLEKATRLLSNLETTDFVELSDLCYQAGALLSFGLDRANGHSNSQQQTRSVPVALISALCPTTDWGQYNTLTLWASLAPTLRDAVAVRYPAERMDIPQLLRAPTVVTNESLNDLLSHLQANQALWNCYDCSDEDFREILSPHVLIDH